jgi:ribosomal protein L37AE/L43A
VRTPIADRQEEISQLFDRYHSTPSLAQQPIAQTPPSPPLSDARVLELLRIAKNKDKFERLYDHGDLADYGDDESAADQALVNLIYFYTQDEDQIDRIFQNSALCWPKWLNRSDYRERTIGKAQESLSELYQPDDGARLIVGGGGSNGHKGASLSPSLIDKGQGHLSIERFADSPPPNKPREFVIEGMAVKGHAVAIFGDGGVAKSTLSQDAGQRIARGEPWMGHTTKQMPVLLVDFELDYEEQSRRAYEVAAGQGHKQPPDDFYYVCAAGFKTRDAFAFALKQCTEKSIGLVIVDSLGVALQGDAESSNDVLSFFREVEGVFRRAGITLWIVDHQSKLQAGERYQNKTMFGSVYKSNMVRNVLQVEATEREEGALNLVVRHKKMNFGPMIEPFGIRIEFEHAKTIVQCRELAPGELAEEGTLNANDRVLLALEDGAAFPDDLVERTGLAKKTVKNALTKLHKTGKIEYTGNERNQAREVCLTGVPSVPTPIGDRDGDTPQKPTTTEIYEATCLSCNRKTEFRKEGSVEECLNCGALLDFSRPHMTSERLRAERNRV